MIAIIAAMEIEKDAMVKHMQSVRTEVISGISFTLGEVSGKEVIVVLSGVGKVQAALSTVVLLEHYTIEQVINIGTAGGLDPKQNILDIVLSERVVQHDFDTSALDGEEGRGKYFVADEQLKNICKEVFTEMDLPFQEGMVASGDQFISESEQLHRLETYFKDAKCAEMEAGAIAQVCSHYHVPFVVIRSLSDVAHKEQSEMDFVTYAKKASERSAVFCKEVIAKI